MSRLPLAAVLLLAPLAACNDTNEVAPAGLEPTVSNTGLALGPFDLAGDGEPWLFAASEAESGGRDLDGDGDAHDRVVHVQDAESGTTSNTAFALDPRLPFLGAHGGLGLFVASESAGGGRDRNGDSDAADAVAVVVDGASGTTRDLGVALALDSVPDVRDGMAALVVSEAAQGGRDLDGDGSAGGNVLFLYDLAADELVNTRVALGFGARVFLGDGRVAFLAREVGVDLNGDGDPQDVAVLQIFDPSDGSVASSGLETLGLPPLYAGGAWLVVVPEEGQDLDLNFDGDRDDLVLQVFDARLGVARNSGLAVDGSSAAIASRLPVGNERFGLLLPEIDVDHNGDGDRLDRVAFLYDPRRNLLRNSNRDAARIEFAGPYLAFLALETGPGDGAAPGGGLDEPSPDDDGDPADLNGDGDAFDAVAFVMNPVTGGKSNLRQDAVEIVGADELLLLARPESGARDYNGDGDREDVVVHAFELASGATTSTGLASAAIFGAAGRELLLAADEAGEGVDLNGDGDRSDAVFTLFDVAARRGSSLGLAGTPPGLGALASDGSVVLLASEAAQGRDLNGDGDLADDVLHRTE